MEHDITLPDFAEWGLNMYRNIRNEDRRPSTIAGELRLIFEQGRILGQREMLNKLRKYHEDDQTG